MSRLWREIPLTSTTKLQLVQGDLTQEAVQDYFISRPDSGVQLVRLALFDQPTLEAFLQAWDSLSWAEGVEPP